MSEQNSHEYRVRPASSDESGRIADLHTTELPEGFLVSLGRGFLGRLYRRIVRSNGSFVLVAASGQSVDGFIAVAEDTGRLYREFFLHDGLVAGAAALPAVLRSPRRTWETFRYGTGADHEDLPRAEVLAVAVAPEARGRGLGGRLLADAIVELQRRRIAAVQVVAGADNTQALRMYERAGFVRRSTVEVHAGVSQVVLVWS